MTGLIHTPPGPIATIRQRLRVGVEEAANLRLENGQPRADYEALVQEALTAPVRDFLSVIPDPGFRTQLVTYLQAAGADLEAIANAPSSPINLPGVGHHPMTWEPGGEVSGPDFGAGRSIVRVVIPTTAAGTKLQVLHSHDVAGDYVASFRAGALHTIPAQAGAAVLLEPDDTAAVLWFKLRLLDGSDQPVAQADGLTCYVVTL